MRILVTGGTGLIGSHLLPLLKKNGHETAILSRSQKDHLSYIWNPEKGKIDLRALENTDTIIHLAGASISGRWTRKYKQQIIDSRVKSALFLYEKIKSSGSPLKTFISASATGIYGDTGDRWVDEGSTSANDFLGESCCLWEEAAGKFTTLGARVVIVRTGLVLADDGGLLPVMLRPVQWGVGAILGTGKQFMSWIHIDDLSRVYLKAVEDNNMSGAYNAVAPNPVSHKHFIKTLAKVHHRHIWLPNIPRWFLKLIFGEKGELISGGQLVKSQKIIDSGFEFRYTDLKNALIDLKAG